MPPRSTRPRRRTPVRRMHAAAGLFVSTTLLFGGAYAASAAPVAAGAGLVSARDDGAALEAFYLASAARVASLQQQAAALGEQANGARWVVQQRTRESEAAATQAKNATRDASSATEAVRRYASLAYQQGGTLGGLAPLLDAGGPQELSDRVSTLDLVGDMYADQIKRAEMATGTATSLRVAAESARTALAQADAEAAAAVARAQEELRRAEAETARLKAERERVARQLARIRHTSTASQAHHLNQLGAEDETIPDPRPQASSTPSSAPTQMGSAPSSTTPPTSTSSTTGGVITSSTTTTPPQTTSTSDSPTSYPNSTSSSTSTTAEPLTSSTSSTTTTTTTSTSTSTSTTPSSTSTTTPPPSSGAAAAVEYAKAQLGKWYEWGAAGPDTFDCSGLTMMAWQQAGVYLSHYTGAQWTETARVPIADLLPGDIVFYGYSGETSTHVGLYVGGGQMIEAPHTGAQIRYASIYRSDLLPYGGRPG